MRIEQIRQTLRTHGAKTCHEERIMRAWLQAQPLASGPRRRPSEDFHPLELRSALPGLAAELSGLARLRSSHPGEDGSERLLVELADGQTIESVLLPRDGLCVSTQVGCAVGCVFCMTGRDGLLRQVDSAEIVAQVVLARARRPVKRVVFMGMGEPAHNLENVLEAIDLLGTAGGIGHKNLVFRRSAICGFLSGCPWKPSNQPSPCRCIQPMPSYALACCPKRPASTRLNWLNSVSNTLPHGVPDPVPMDFAGRDQ